MNRLASLDEFIGFRERILSERAVHSKRLTLVVSAGTCGQASGANDVIRIIKRYIIEKNLRDRVTLRITGCQGFCEMEPFILVEPHRHLYPKVRIGEHGGHRRRGGGRRSDRGAAASPSRDR